MLGGYLGQYYASRPKYANRVRILDCPKKAAYSYLNYPYYGVNSYLQASSAGVPPATTFRKAQFPASCILTGDSTVLAYMDAQWGQRMDDRHNQGAVVAFCDGHAEHRAHASLYLCRYGYGNPAYMTAQDYLTMWEGK